MAARGSWGRKWVKVVKRYKFQVVRLKSPGNVMYSMVIVVKKTKQNCTVYMKVAKRLHLKSSHRKKKNNYVR